jgi:hypothetical protein
MLACLLVSVCAAQAPIRARAHAQAGDSASALPGIVRVGIPSSERRPLALAGSAGYGVTESQAGEGAHHRATGTLAASIGAARFLALGLRLDGRYDRHPADAMGGDDGWVGDPRLYARAGFALNDSVRAGGELLAWLPGASAPSFVPKATTVDFKGLLTLKNREGLELATLAGLRWDNSAKAAPSNASLRAGDRIALGASDFNAVLLGAGVSQRVGGTFEVLGELSADLLIGSGAPGLMQSPIRLSGGARYHSSPELTWEAVLDASLSERPTLGPTSSHIPIEPRFSIQVGARYAFGSAKPVAPVEPQLEAAPMPAPVMTAMLFGSVVDQEGAPVDGASIAVEVMGTTRTTQSASDGGYQLGHLPLGSAQVTLKGEGLEETVQSVELGSAQVELELHATRSVATGQIRGLVRSFAGEGLPAKIEVKTLGRKVSADASGKFELDVPPGQYEVSVEMAGYARQKRSVTVEKNGVTLLNVELRGRKP